MNADNKNQLTKQERKALLKFAKEAVEAAVKGHEPNFLPPVFMTLKKKGAAFVTLKKKGELRGCIGHVIATIPLYQCVVDMATCAALNDHRFSPVQIFELDELSYEISVLTSPCPIEPQDVIVGKHGLIAQKGLKKGLLLPQVPLQFGWSSQEFLSHTCQKAGLDPHCWKTEKISFEAFEAIVFSDENI